MKVIGVHEFQTLSFLKVPRQLLISVEQSRLYKYLLIFCLRKHCLSACNLTVITSSVRPTIYFTWLTKTTFVFNMNTFNSCNLKNSIPNLWNPVVSACTTFYNIQNLWTLQRNLFNCFVQFCLQKTNYFRTRYQAIILETYCILCDARND
jgi:hypothetical protein